MSEGLAMVLKAAAFAARRHAGQRRKGAAGDPYINHPLEVASLLAGPGNIDDPVIIAAGLLHDTLEDTATTAAELEEQFGQCVRHLVEEVSDDKTIPGGVRRELQVQKALAYSPGAKAVRIADKVSNMDDVIHRPPPDWSEARKGRYVEWAARVVEHCRGVNVHLEKLFDERVAVFSRGA
jgi:(p)ppGpp synthase/HD superfamily hydrolase